jgi:hypothetical protein
LVVLGLLEAAEQTSWGLVLDLADVGTVVPTFAVLAVFGVFAIFGMAVPLGVLIWVVTTRNWRLIGLYFLTTITAAASVRSLRGYIEAREPDLPGRAPAPARIPNPPSCCGWPARS